MVKENKKRKLDLRGVKCPMNFVKTKLEIEKMENHELLEILLTDKVAVKDIPRSLEMEGHKVLKSSEKEDGKEYILLVRKG